jgi:hypothetical protein
MPMVSIDETSREVAKDDPMGELELCQDFDENAIPALLEKLRQPNQADSLSAGRALGVALQSDQCPRRHQRDAAEDILGDGGALLVTLCSLSATKALCAIATHQSQHKKIAKHTAFEKLLVQSLQKHAPAESGTTTVVSKAHAGEKEDPVDDTSRGLHDASAEELMEAVSALSETAPLFQMGTPKPFRMEKRTPEKKIVPDKIPRLQRTVPLLLVRLCRHSSLQIRFDAAKAVTNLGETKAQKDAFISHGAVEALLAILQGPDFTPSAVNGVVTSGGKGEGEPEVLSGLHCVTVSALSNLVTELKGKTRFLEHDGLACFQEAVFLRCSLDSHDSNSQKQTDIGLRISSALYNLGTNSPGTKADMLRGGVLRVLQILLRSTTNCATRSMVCYCFQSLSFPESPVPAKKGKGKRTRTRKRGRAACPKTSSAAEDDGDQDVTSIWNSKEGLDAILAMVSPGRQKSVCDAGLKILCGCLAPAHTRSVLSSGGAPVFDVDVLREGLNDEIQTYLIQRGFPFLIGSWDTALSEIMLSVFLVYGANANGNNDSNGGRIASLESICKRAILQSNTKALRDDNVLFAWRCAHELQDLELQVRCCKFVAKSLNNEGKKKLYIYASSKRYAEDFFDEYEVEDAMLMCVRAVGDEATLR